MKAISRVVFHAVIVLTLLTMGVKAIGSLVADSVGPEEAMELWGRWREPTPADSVRIRMDAGRERRIEGVSARHSLSSEPERAVAGATATLYFQPTRRLMDFLTAIDRLDRERTLRSIEKFLAERGGELAESGLREPVQLFAELLSAHVPLPEAVIDILVEHGMRGKSALERVIEIKREEYAGKLDKYVRLKVELGVDKPHKIIRYERKVWMVDELQNELDKSFR